MSDFKEQTYYELLEISTSASTDEVQQAYLRAKGIYAPDSPAIYTIFSRDEAVQLNHLLDEAYQTLSHHAKRREYDLKLQTGNYTVIHDKATTADVQQAKPAVMPSLTPDDKKELARQGIGITKFGQYTIDPMVEHEMQQQQMFDGTFLKKVRIYKNINLETLCEHLKIGRHHFNAIENNDFNKLPATVFVRGYVKQMAESLGLDAQKVTDSYMRILKDVRD
ncbi:MAG: helix-turn-helix domain-containing protein [Bdellovibrionales bacterium]|nr:helix-turn-helix domain-containing protein [Bdellovibrionales bacterium]